LSYFIFENIIFLFSCWENERVIGNFAIHREIRNILYIHSGILRTVNENMLVSRPHPKLNVKINS